MRHLVHDCKTRAEAGAVVAVEVLVEEEVVLSGGVGLESFGAAVDGSVSVAVG